MKFTKCLACLLVLAACSSLPEPEAEIGLVMTSMSYLVAEGRYHGNVVRVLIDSGSGHENAISSKYIRFVSPIPGKVSVRKGLDRREKKRPVYLVKRLKLAGKLVPDFEATILNQDEMKTYDFVIGPKQLSHFVLHYMPNGRFRLLKEPIEGKGLELKIDYKTGLPLINAKIDKKTVENMVVDTGSGVSKIDLAHLEGVEYEDMPNASLSKAIDESIQERKFIKAHSVCLNTNCSWGHIMMPGHYQSVLYPSGTKVSGYLGWNFLKKREFYLDLKSAKLHFK